MFSSLGRAGIPAFLQYKEIEWRLKNRLLFDLADGDCSKCEAIVSESRRLCKNLEDRSDKETKEVCRQFDLRIGDIEFWRKELDRLVAALQDADDLLTRLITRMKNAARGCEDPIKTCKAILIHRDSRKGIDLVDDVPQQQLQKYLALLYDTVAVLNRTINEAEEQIRANNQVMHRLQRDISDKFEALSIDFKALAKDSSDVTPSSLKFNHDLLKPAKGAVTLADWESWTMHNVEKAEHERSCTDKLRPLIEQILKQTYEDLELQRRKTVDATKDRLKDLMDAQKHLDERIGRVDEQIVNIKYTQDNLQQALDDKIKLLDLAQLRMIQRRSRPRMELVRDSVDSELDQEVGLLTKSIEQLQEQLNEAAFMLGQLQNDKLGLLKEVEIKKDTIFLDETKTLNGLATLAHHMY